jgi:hypothetical protein
MSCGKTTAPSGKLDIVGNLNVTGSIVSGGSTSGSNPLVVSSATIGQGVTVSTFDAAGNAIIAGTLESKGAATMDGALGVTGALSANGGLAVTGSSTLYVRSAAQINAITGAVGRAYICSDCTNTYTICIATGTAANQYREVGTATGCK